MRWNQVKFVTALMLMLGLIAGGVCTFHSLAAEPKEGKNTPAVEAKTKEAPETKADEKPRPDWLAIKGVWTLVYRESKGKRETLTEESLKNGNGKLTISGGRFTFVDEGTTHDGICKINTAKTPKQIDLILAPDPDEVAHAIFRGIYTIEKDKLTICYNNPHRDLGLPRPTEIATRADEPYPTIAVFKRTSETDEQKLQGVWNVESAVMDNEEVAGLKGIEFVFANDTGKTTLERGEGMFIFKVDTFSSPKKIDLVGAEDGPYEGFQFLGVYAIDGDELKIYGTGTGKRPTELKGEFGKKHVEIVLKRAKK